jgi:hypothetical protein
VDDACPGIPGDLTRRVLGQGIDDQQLVNQPAALDQFVADRSDDRGDGRRLVARRDHDADARAGSVLRGQQIRDRVLAVAVRVGLEPRSSGGAHVDQASPRTALATGRLPRIEATMSTV